MKTKAIKIFWGFSVIALLVGCQTLQPVTPEQANFERVVEAPGKSQDEIYKIIKVWMAKSFGSSKEVIELDSKEDGIIIGNGIIDYPCQGLSCMAKEDWTVPFTMQIDIKDEKFRLTFSNVKLSWPPSYSATVGSSPAYDGAIRNIGDLNAIKPKLLSLSLILI